MDHPACSRLVHATVSVAHATIKLRIPQIANCVTAMTSVGHPFGQPAIDVDVHRPRKRAVSLRIAREETPNR